MFPDTMEVQLEGKNGRYDSPITAYPGFIELPFPFMGRHYKAWLKATRAVMNNSKADEVDSLPAFAEWAGAVALVTKFAIEGLSASEFTVDGDNIPMIVQQWIKTAIASYLAEQFDIKNLLVPSETS